MKEYRRCSRCVMTEQADPEIKFNDMGYCNYCVKAIEDGKNIYFPNEVGKEKLEKLIRRLKEKNKDKKYDCLMGISGGLDSCYLAYLGAVKWKLRIVAIHIDDGFDTEISKENIKKLCEKCNIEIKMIRPDDKQFCELSRAYFFAGAPNLAVPQDNVLFSCIYKYAKEEKIYDFLSGSNYSLESILQKGNTHNCFDLVNIKNINKYCGRDKVDKLPLMSEWKKYLDQVIMNVKVYAPLNYVDYRRETALKELSDFCEFEYYGSKHLENYFTGFLQMYWLPKKFDIDKRTSHFSSMIVSGQMTRENALKILAEPPCSEEWLEKAIQLIKQKLDISEEEFLTVMDKKPHCHKEYKTDKLFGLYVRMRYRGKK